MRLGVGACVHVARVAEGELGADGDRRLDIIGTGVNYRQLPNACRSVWRKQKPPAIYTMSPQDSGSGTPSSGSS